MEYAKVFAQEILQGFTKDSMYILMLTEPVEMLSVPMLIGEHEAEMIMMEHETRQPRRPMTHHLVLSLCETFHLELKKVTIDRYFEGVFYATLHVSDGIMVRKIDCRASDAIALALHEGLDILMNKAILNETGAPPPWSDQTEDDETTMPLSPNVMTIDSAYESLTTEELEKELHRCEREEDYEKAEQINKILEKRRNGPDQQNPTE
ncbi:MAG: bifunctional nuclease family protein [Bacteroidales bacterium]|nr:bifunctional nuclease family protein [Bacteroidales bacterium]